MKKRSALELTIGVIMLAGLLAVIPLMSGCRAGPPEEKIWKFAHIGDFSGPAAPWGITHQFVFDLWADDVNAAGGIKVGDDYYKVEIVPYDMEWSATVALTVARKAIYDDGIKYLLFMDNDAVIAATDLVQENNCFAFASGPMGADIGAERPNFFQSYWNTQFFWKHQIEFLLKGHPEWTTIVLVAPDNLMGRADGPKWNSRIKPLEEELGITTLEPIYYEPGTVDYYSMLTVLLDQGVDILQFGPGGPIDQATMVKQARELGFEGNFSSNDMNPEYLSIAGAEAVEGLVGMGDFPEEMYTDLGKSFRDQLIAEFGYCAPYACNDYDYMTGLKVAIETAGTLDVDEVIKAQEEVTIGEEVTVVKGQLSYIADEFSEGLKRVLRVQLVLCQFQNGERVPVSYFYTE